ncbi:MAG TPA: SRPBCC domain-containing protein [Chloroflexia bacterium]|nr:SRPBCC domain-containing protein [Chloroflexia bacterium]
MELTGSVASQAEKERLWDAIFNASYWKEAIPDAEKYEKIGDNLYEMAVKVDIGPIKGNQTVKVQFSELQPPDSCDFEVQNQLVKTAKGSFTLKDAAEAVAVDADDPLPEGTKTVLDYRLEADAGNPFFNAMLEGFKGKIKDGFEELLGRVEEKAR